MTVRSRPRDPAGGEGPIKIGVSACLLGQMVRYDGGHKRNEFLVEIFGPFVEWVPVCPEVELGLGTPREPIRLVEANGGVRLAATKSGTDHTAAMRAYARKRVAALAGADLCGYVLKKGSPSCGMERVKVYGGGVMPSKGGRGLFAAVLLDALPHLPVEEEGRLNDPRLRDNFIERVFAFRRLQSLFGPRWSRGDVVAFHTAHKLQLLAHSPRHYERLGRLVAEIKRVGREAFRSRYEAEFMSALHVLATRRRHVNVLQHVVGYCRPQLDAVSRAELLAVINDYGNGLIPLIAPLTLVRHYVRRFALEYLGRQVYLEPHPKELMLRNHV